MQKLRNIKSTIDTRSTTAPRTHAHTHTHTHADTHICPSALPPNDRAGPRPPKTMRLRGRVNGKKLQRAKEERARIQRENHLLIRKILDVDYRHKKASVWAGAAGIARVCL